MIRLIYLLVIWSALLFATLAFAQQVAEPDLGKDVGDLIDAVRSGRAIAIAAAVIMILVNLFKLPWLGGLTKKIPKRWRIAIPIILSGVAAILMGIVG